jgi:hypothetical protein
MSVETLTCSLTQEEKCYAVELLWASLWGDAQGYTPPGWHTDVLAERMQNPSSEPSKPLGAAMEDIRRRVHEYPKEAISEPSGPMQGSVRVMPCRYESVRIPQVGDGLQVERTTWKRLGAVVKYNHLDTTTGLLLMLTSDSQSVRHTHWYSPTVGKFLCVILALQVVLYLSQRFQWFALNQLKGHTVVIAVTATAIGLLLIAGVVLFGRKAQFTLATLMFMAPVMAIPCSWLVREMSQAQRQAQIVAECEPYRLNYNTPSPDSAVRRWFEPIFGKYLFVEVTELLTDQADDANLVLLKEVTQLERLYLGRTNVTDAGLEHLKGLANLRFLLLDGTNVTDAGLVHLKELTQLEQLWLDETYVTDAGVADLQTALKGCSIIHNPESWRRRAPRKGTPRP